MSETLTKSAFARLQGWSPSYVTKLKDAGRLVLTGDGLVDVEASLARITATESGQPQHAAGRRAHADHRDGGATPDSSEAAPGGEDSGKTTDPRSRSYWERVDAEERARIRTIERRRLEGELVETVAVRSAGAEAGTMLRTVLEGLTDRLAPALAEGDPEREQRIRARLAEHIGLALVEVSDKLKALTEEVAAPPA